MRHVHYIITIHESGCYKFVHLEALAGVAKVIQVLDLSSINTITKCFYSPNPKSFCIAAIATLPLAIHQSNNKYYDESTSENIISYMLCVWLLRTYIRYFMRKC